MGGLISKQPDFPERYESASGQKQVRQDARHIGIVLDDQDVRDIVHARAVGFGGKAAIIGTNALDIHMTYRRASECRDRFPPQGAAGPIDRSVAHRAAAGG